MPEYRERRAPAALAPWVECSWELAIEGSRPAYAHRVLPDGCIDLVWTAAAGLQIVGPNATAFMAELDPATSAVGVRMHPGGAPPLLGVSAPGLLDARVTPSELWGVRGGRLEDEVSGARTPAQRTAVLLHWLRLQARAARTPDPVVWSLRTRLTAAALPIGDFAREIGYGERQLRRRVLAEVGYGPKHLARVLRLRRTLALARSATSLSLTELAYDGGYADQAHLCHECTALAGATPTALLLAA